MCFTIHNSHKANACSDYIYVGFAVQAEKEIEMEADFEIASGSDTSLLTGKLKQ